MQTALERRQEILEHLSDCRFDTIANLMSAFHASRSTIKRDIEVLSCSYPLETVRGNGGGVRVADGYYVGRRYLNSKQETLLRGLMDGLQAEDQETLQSILTAFARPIPQGGKKSRGTSPNARKG